MNKNQITINLATQNFKNNLIKVINQSELPVVNIYLVWQLLMKEIKMSYYQEINDEEDMINQKNTDNIEED